MDQLEQSGQSNIQMDQREHSGQICAIIQVDREWKGQGEQRVSEPDRVEEGINDQDKDDDEEEEEEVIVWKRRKERDGREGVKKRFRVVTEEDECDEIR